jgi:hypothetical protein
MRILLHRWYVWPKPGVAVATIDIGSVRLQPDRRFRESPASGRPVNDHEFDPPRTQQGSDCSTNTHPVDHAHACARPLTRTGLAVAVQCTHYGPDYASADRPCANGMTLDGDRATSAAGMERWTPPAETTISVSDAFTRPACPAEGGHYRRFNSRLLWHESSVVSAFRFRLGDALWRATFACDPVVAAHFIVTAAQASVNG